MHFIFLDIKFYMGPFAAASGLSYLENFDSVHSLLHLHFKLVGLACVSEWFLND